MSNPDHIIVYKPTRPHFTISLVKSISTFRCVTETYYEVISRIAIDKSGWKCLDACGLIGIGQSYYVLSTEVITDQVPPKLIDRRTGLEVEGPVIDWMGREITKSTEYDYHRYMVRRTCDSGD